MFNETMVDSLKSALKEVVSSFFTTFSDLPYENSFQLLIAVLLSSQTRDVVTAKVCKQLFKNVVSPRDLLCMTEKEIFFIIRPVNYSTKKVSIIRNVSKTLWIKNEKHFPFSMALKFVGQKTSDVLYNNLSSENKIAVDANILRVLNRVFGRKLSYIQAQSFLNSCFCYKDRFVVSNSLISFGRSVCNTHPKCSICVLAPYCSFEVK